MKDAVKELCREESHSHSGVWADRSMQSISNILNTKMGGLIGGNYEIHGNGCTLLIDKEVGDIIN